MNDISSAQEKVIIIYDGNCVFCSRSMLYLLKRDKHDLFRFTTRDSISTQALIEKHGLNLELLDTILVIHKYDIYKEASAIEYLCSTLNWQHRVFAFFLQLIPVALKNFGYRTVAKYRHILKLKKCDLSKISAMEYKLLKDV